MTVLKVEHVTKEFVVCDSQAAWLLKWLGIPSESWRLRTVLQDVSFVLRAGDALAIHGANGSGKSTLLKLICGALTPSSGSIEVTGRIGSIIELGIGLDGEASGQENARLLFSRIVAPPMDEKQFLEAVTAYSGLGDQFRQRVKHYSSGMVSRLAFAGAIVVRPDLLIVDEALSVGDATFQEKCISTIKEYLSLGTALIFVSHAKSNVDLFNMHAQIENGYFRIDE